jgi:hypothetical protein
MNKITLIVFFFSLVLVSCHSNSEFEVKSEVPDLTMPGNGLTFKEIENYKNYKIIATHFRTDKNEIRYILANPKAFKSYNEGSSFPNGSKIVKIGWDVEQMSNFPTAIEAKEVQRVEYMIKDSKTFKDNPGNWGYARFVKKDGKYESWNQGTASCVACHNLAKDNDFLFTKFQKLQ